MGATVMTPPANSNVEVLVAIGRIEEMLKSMAEKLDKLEEQTEKKFALVDAERDRVWKKLNSLDTLIQLLQDKAEKPAPKSWEPRAAVLISIATFIVFILDRFYVNQ